MKENPSYYSIIPASVRYDKELKANEKLLYSEITCLTQSTGECWAGNSYFSELYGVTKKSISGWISNLVKRGYIKTKYIRNTDNVIEKRIISLTEKIGGVSLKTSRGYGRKLLGGMEEKVIDNITSNNNTSINKVRVDNEGLVELKDRYSELYKGKYSHYPTTDKYSTITSKIKTLLKSRSSAQISGALKAYFEDTDPFLSKNSYGINWFASNIDRWIIATPKKDIRDGADAFFDRIEKEQKDKIK